MGEDASDGRRTGDYDALYKSYVSLLKQVDHLSTLREIALAINSSIELNEVLPIIASVVQGALDVRRLTIYQFDDAAGMGRPVVAKYGRDLITRDRLAEESVQMAGTPLADVIETHMPIFVDSEFQSHAYVPLIAKSVPIAVMHLEDRNDGVPFSQEDSDLFLGIGSMIAIAINNAQLYSEAVYDGLTGLYVRRYFDLRMTEELEQARRYKRTFSLVLLDIDHFKKFNDTYGHQTGDLVLKGFAELLQNNTRKSDVTCRYGGEEMAVILPETAIEEAEILANKLCDSIRRAQFEGTSGEKLSVTASLGVAEHSSEYKSPQAMIEAADQALYRAKEAGRNRVELADS